MSGSPANSGPRSSFHLAGKGRPSTTAGIARDRCSGLQYVPGDRERAPPVRATFFGSLGDLFGKIDAGLSVLLFLFAGWAYARALAGVRSFLLRGSLLTLLIWGVRYALLWLDVPSGFLAGGAFDPGLFASKFGFGLAGSIGELTITTVALSLNVAFVLNFRLREKSPASPARPLPLPLRIVAAAAATVILFWILRGYGAAIEAVCLIPPSRISMRAYFSLLRRLCSWP